MNTSTNFAETQKEAASLLVGKRVVYSITKDTTSRGIVLDKADIKDKSTDTFTVTGYLIQDEASGEISPIAYWRIKKICSAAEGYLKGGFNRATNTEH